mgnify:CR=1 FL=1
MNTFIDLFNFLKEYNGISIVPWLQDAWTGKDKQESLLRLFYGLGFYSGYLYKETSNDGSD